MNCLRAHVGGAWWQVELLSTGIDFASTLHTPMGYMYGCTRSDDCRSRPSVDATTWRRGGAGKPSHHRLHRLSQHVVGSVTVARSGVVQATIPYRKLTEDGERLVFLPDGDAFDMRPHPVEDLRELGETSLLNDGFIMKRNVTRANTELLSPWAEKLDDPEHLRVGAAERLTYRLEMEALARESFPGHNVRLVMAGGPTGEDGVPNGNVFTRMSELPPGIVPGPDVVQRGGPVKASGIVHSDLGAGHGPRFYSQLRETGPAGRHAQRVLQEAGLTPEDLQDCRHMILQLWRPITDTAIQMDPLAILDPRSLAEGDLYGTGLRQEDPADQRGLNPGRFAA